MKKKRLATLSLALVMATTPLTSFAAEWKQDANGWLYQNDDGSYAQNTWVGEYYCGSDGYMLTNTITPDGTTVGADGAKINPPLFDIDEPKFHATYIKSYTTTDYNGDPAIAIIFNFTNKESEPTSYYGSDMYIKAFQNGIECDSTMIGYSKSRDEVFDNSSKDIMQGITLPVARVFKIKDKSDIIITIKDVFNWERSYKGTTVTLHLQ